MSVSCHNRAGFVGSGNLTGSGLGGQPRANLELGIALDPAQAKAASKVLRDWRAGATPVIEAMIKACEREAALLPATTPRPPGHSGPRASADEVLKAGVVATQVWVKALYYDAVMAEERSGQDDWVASPAKGKPSFLPGDLLLIYASHTGVCNAVVRVTGPTRDDPAFLLATGRPADDAARWPWVTPV